VSTTSLAILAAFSEPSGRQVAAERAAKWLGVDEVLLFIRDPELSVLLPAPGFKQTIAGGPAWRELLARCARRPGMHRTTLPSPAGDEVTSVVARVLESGAALVLVGGTPDHARLDELSVGLPLLVALLEAEQGRLISEADARVAREEGRHARDLAGALDQVRGQVEQALAESARLNDELKENDRRKDEFLAMLGHELRNPMAAIAGALEVMRLKPDDPSAAGRAYRIIDRQAAQLARLVDDLLDVARISKGKIVLRPEAVRVEAIVQRAVDTTRRLVEKRRHQVTVHVDPSLHVLADAARFEQMATNLLMNAAKYTNEGGQIRVSATLEGPTVALQVADNGIGIDAEMLKRVFDVFVQVAPTVDRAAGGLGVGLTLVKRLALLHGGSIDATSEPGKGSTFTLRLPACAPPRVASVAPPRVVGASKRVLVVDDNIDSAEMLVEVASRWGHRAVYAADGPHALRLAEELRPDIVLLDIGLPGMDGYEVASHLRGSERTRDAQIIALSGYGQEDDRKKSRAAGCDGHLVKPVDMKQLANLLGAA
jgi:signal transduction histidine kinase